LCVEEELGKVKGVHTKIYRVWFTALIVGLGSISSGLLGCGARAPESPTVAAVETPENPNTYTGTPIENPSVSPELFSLYLDRA
jgi:hypothetical protein